MANFKIGTNDFSNHVIAGTYSIFKNELYNTWTDGNGNNHKRLKRTQVKGKFDMFFKTMTEYQAFVNAIEAAKSTSGAAYIQATLTDNYSNADIRSNYYLSFNPIRNIDSKWNDCFGKFSVSVEEY